VHRYRERVNFSNETDRLEKNGIDVMVQLPIESRTVVKEKEKRRENFSSIFDYTN
jgi:hypothetical protein